MGEVLTLIGSIMFIACLQIVFEMIIDQGSKPYLSKVLNISCYVGALLLLLRFIFDNLMTEISALFRLTF